MSTRIVQAINVMVSNPKLIGPVLRGQKGELFFMYKDQYKWSMRRDDEGAHWLYYYPGKETLQKLASYDESDWEGCEMVTYSDVQIGTREAKATFADLYSLLSEKVYGLDKVLDDIISDDIPF